jgi:hypothetical protein
MSRLNERLPTREQIAAIEDIDALEDIRNEILLTAERIETDLEFGDRSEEWASRARNALALHRHVGRQISRRIGILRERERFEERQEASVRPADTCHPLTLEVLAKAPVILVDALETIAEVDTWDAYLAERVEAVTGDREDEKTLDMRDFDHAFFAATKAVLKTMTALRGELAARRRHLVKRDRIAANKERQRPREELFIHLVRERYGPEIFAELWAAVDEAIDRKVAA